MLKIFGLSLLAALIITFTASANSLHIAEDLIEEAIIDNSEFSDNETSVEVRLTEGRSELEKLVTDELELTGIEVDTQKKTFAGFIVSNDVIPFEVEGRYTEMVQIPVITHKLSRDEVISLNDIEYMGVDSRKLSRGYITDESLLIGKSPTRTLFKKRPVMPSQIAEPTLVKKKEAVTMVFRNNLLQMQDVGVAMQDGGKGELIRIRNENSNIIVNARVISSGLVEVESGTQHLALNN